MEMHAGTAIGPWPELESVFTIRSVILPLQRPIEKWVKTLFSGGVGTCPAKPQPLALASQPNCISFRCHRGMGRNGSQALSD